MKEKEERDLSREALMYVWNPSVMVVEDDEALLRLFQKELSGHGFELKTYADAFLAMETLKGRSFSVIVADIRMPRMDGIEFVRKVKQRYPQTEIIMITGYGSLETAIEALKIGAYDYILKPFKSLDVVISTIKRALEKRRLSLERERNEHIRSVLYQLSLDTNYVTEVKDIFDLSLDALLQMIDSEVYAYYLIKDETKKLLKIRALKPASVSYIEKVSNMAIGEIPSIGLHFVKGNFSVLQEGRWVQEEGLFWDEIESVSTPVEVEGKFIGAFQIASPRKDAFGEAEIQILKLLSDQCSNTVKKLMIFKDEQRSMILRLIDTISDGVVMLDENGRVCNANENAIKLLKPDFQPSGDSYANMIDPDDILSVLGFSSVEEISKTGFLKMDKKINDRKYSITLSKIIDSEGRFTGSIIIFHPL